jgi:hypothetical protein
MKKFLIEIKIGRFRLTIGGFVIYCTYAADHDKRFFPPITRSIRAGALSTPARCTLDRSCR